MINRIAERCKLSNVPFKFSATDEMRNRDYLVIGFIGRVPFFYSLKAFFELFWKINDMGRFSSVVIDDMLRKL